MCVHTRVYVLIYCIILFDAQIALHRYLLCPLEMAPVIFFIVFLFMGPLTLVPGSVCTLLAIDLKSAIPVGSLDSF